MSKIRGLGIRFGPLKHVLAGVAALALLTACPPGMNPDPMDPDPMDPEEHRLSITLQADMEDSRNHSVHIFIDDVAHTRETAPYDDQSIRLREFQANSGQEMTAFDVEAGKIVTLVAFDGGASRSGTVNVATQDPLFSSPSLNEFLDYEGVDDVAVDMGLGVISFTMSSDLDVTALFQRMPQVIVYQEVTGAGSPGATLFSVQVSDYLSFPGSVVTFKDSIQSVPIPIVYTAQLRTGSVVTLTAIDVGDSTFERWGGDTPFCGSNPICEFDTSDGTIIATENWRMSIVK